MDDTIYMDRALNLAERGRGRTSPNPMVGALIVSPAGVVVGTGYHEKAGMSHAEVLALSEAGAQAYGATLYCTLEPCCHTGRTGPCVERIAASGISRVVIGIEDPNPLVNGAGIRYLKSQGIQVEVGIREKEVARQNEVFLTFMRKDRPFVIMKVAMSEDGRIAAIPGSRTQLTSEKALVHVHEIRGEIDAIGVGSETILSDDPFLTAREIFRPRPLCRVLFDRRLRISSSARVFSTLYAGPVIIMTTADSLKAAPERALALQSVGATIESLEESGIEYAMSRLAKLGVTSLILEGGVELHRSAWTARVVDRVQIYLSPVQLGGKGLSWLVDEEFSISALRDISIRSLDPDVLIEGYVHWTD